MDDITHHTQVVGLPPSVHSPLLSGLFFCPSPPSGLLTAFSINLFYSSTLSSLWIKWLFGDEGTKRGKHIITLCLFEFLSSCCHSYSCYIDWCPYEAGYCLTSPPTFAQIRKINKITAATPALPYTNNTLLTPQHPAPNFHILHLMVREERKVDLKHMLEREQEDEMVNVSTQVTSSMELPFGEYRLLLCVFFL